jgi:hypothetical protein
MLFNGSISTEWVTKHDRIWNKISVADFDILLQHLYEGTEENHEYPLPG